MKRKFLMVLVLSCLMLAWTASACTAEEKSRFSDVPADAWYAQAVGYCQEQGLMSGTSSTSFEPNVLTTRAMLVTILYQKAGSPEVNSLPDFSDTQPQAWYSQAVAWATETGLVQGYGNNYFGTNDPVTHEQFAVILWQSAGSPVVEKAANLADTSLISAYALPAVNWAAEQGILLNQMGNRLAPQAGTTRAETAAMLYNWLNPASTVQPTAKVEQGSKVLVAYFSRSGNTQKVAEEVATLTGGDLFEIVPEQAYPAEYEACGEQAMQELKSNARPALASQVENMADYEVVFLGFPIWHGTTPMLIRTFLEEYDLNGKIIAPFSTSGSSSISPAVSDIRSLCPNSEVQDGLSIPSDQLDQFKSLTENWLDSLKTVLPTSANLETQVGTSLPYDSVYPQHEPYGVGVGAMPGRVVWNHDPNSVNWDGSDYWWNPANFSETVILQMLNDSIASLGGTDTAVEGWNILFLAHNAAQGNAEGYQKGQKIAIKANINGSGVFGDDTSGQTQMSYTNPVLLKALLTSLVTEAGISPNDITVYDVSRLFPDYMREICTSGVLTGVNFVQRNNAQADLNRPIIWSQAFRGDEAVNHLPTCVTQADYLINLANLKGHSYGITLGAKNHFGSFINNNAMRPPEGAGLHQFLTANTMNSYTVLVDLMANYQLGGKTVLYLLDALICAPTEGSSITSDNSKWQQSSFNNDYTSSVFLSQDPVALDSVGADFLMNEPAVIENNGALKNNPNVENYLHEAGLVAQAPSGAVYYNGNGQAVSNLGVHEHWNNSTEKLYSRNLGQKEGIELIYLKSTK